jgi:hypothetical protein
MNKIKPNTVYVWRDGDVYYAAAKVVFDGYQHIYGYGWKVERPFWSETLSETVPIQRARHSAITVVQNTLNAIRLYGKNVLDLKGNVIWKNVEASERTAAELVPDFRTRYRVIKYPHEDITLQEAIQLGIA